MDHLAIRFGHAEIEVKIMDGFINSSRLILINFQTSRIVA